MATTPCPEITINIEDSPRATMNNSWGQGTSADGDFNLMSEEARIQMILSGRVPLKNAQKPLKLSAVEEVVAKRIANQRDYIASNKVHCTVCNKHMGSACVDQFDRYVHPVLNVIICKKCYDFFSNGDFEKDEDGSEIYCKWCGEGGTVMCCSTCCYVFCYQCVRRNLGQKKAHDIKTAEKWRCFRCAPEQLTTFHVTTFIVHEFVNRYTKLAIEKKSIALLKLDITTCCSRSRKRKSLKDLDEEFMPATKKKSSPPMKQKKVAELRKSPPRSNAITQIPDRLPLATRSDQNCNAAVPPAAAVSIIQKSVNPVPGLIKVKKLSAASPQSRFLQAHNLMPSFMPLQTAPSAVSMLINTSNMPVASTSAAPPTRNAPDLHKPHAIDWIKKAVRSTRITCKLLVRQLQALEALAEARMVHRDLAQIHNSAQNNIFECNNKLLELRKVMHADFLLYLRSINVKFSVQSRTNGHSTASDSLSTTTTTSTTSVLATTNGLTSTPISAPPTALTARNLVQNNAAKPKQNVMAHIDLCDEEEADTSIDEVREYAVAAMCDAVLEETDEEEEEEGDVRENNVDAETSVEEVVGGAATTSATVVSDEDEALANGSTTDTFSDESLDNARVTCEDATIAEAADASANGAQDQDAEAGGGDIALPKFDRLPPDAAAAAGNAGNMRQATECATNSNTDIISERRSSSPVDVTPAPPRLVNNNNNLMTTSPSLQNQPTSANEKRTSQFIEPSAARGTPSVDKGVPLLEAPSIVDNVDFRSKLRKRIKAPRRLDQEQDVLPNRVCRKSRKSRKRMPLSSVPSALSNVADNARRHAKSLPLDLHGAGKRSSLRVALRASLGTSVSKTTASKENASESDKFNNAKNHLVRNNINDAPPTLTCEVGDNAFDLDAKEDLFGVANLIKELSWIQAGLEAAKRGATIKLHANEMLPPVLTPETEITVLPQDCSARDENERVSSENEQQNVSKEKLSKLSKFAIFGHMIEENLVPSDI